MPLCVLFPAPQLLTVVWSRVCPLRCRCPREPPECGPGVPLVLDDCVCCLVCARQRGEPCSGAQPCDTRRGLRCDYSPDVQKRRGVCAGKLVCKSGCLATGKVAGSIPGLRRLAKCPWARHHLTLTAPDVLVVTLHGWHRRRCMNGWMWGNTVKHLG